jgi:hypothetical protein
MDDGSARQANVVTIAEWAFGVGTVLSATALCVLPKRRGLVQALPRLEGAVEVGSDENGVQNSLNHIVLVREYCTLRVAQCPELEIQQVAWRPPTQHGTHAVAVLACLGEPPANYPDRTGNGRPGLDRSNEDIP